MSIFSNKTDQNRKDDRNSERNNDRSNNEQQRPQPQNKQQHQQVPQRGREVPQVTYVKGPSTRTLVLIGVFIYFTLSKAFHMETADAVATALLTVVFFDIALEGLGF